MGVTLFVAIASLIVSTIGGLLERRRSFVTLRLGGMTVGQMKRTVMIESLIPLVSVSLLASGLGVWVGWVFVSAMSDSAKPTLTPLYFGIVIGSLLIATLAIRQILPMLGKITRPEENQTE
jgi:ABC-type antimicrobial peptide transport system permease subunit